MLTDDSERETGMPETSRNARREMIDVNDAVRIMNVTMPTIWKSVASGKFPKPVKIVGQTTRCFSDEVAGFLADLSESREEGDKKARTKTDGLNQW